MSDQNPKVKQVPMKAGSYKDLMVWQKGMELSKQVYRLTKAFPQDERFWLVSQMRRAAVSIPSNIAEGQARHTSKEFVQFLSHAEGSVAELDTQLLLGIELEFCTRDLAASALDLTAQLKRMRNALRRKLED